MEINGNYYCPGNVIIDHGNVIKLEPEKQELIDYFILDKENKTLSLYDSLISDSFIDGFKNIDSIEMVNNNNSEQKTKTITIKEKSSDKPITIEINKESNSIIGYTNENLTNLGDNFLKYNEQLSEFKVPNATCIGNRALMCNKELEKFEAPNAEKIGFNFLRKNTELREFYVPNLTKESKESLDYLFSVVKENSKGDKIQNIDSTDIAKLDKKTKLQHLK